MPGQKLWGKTKAGEESKGVHMGKCIQGIYTFKC